MPINRSVRVQPRLSAVHTSSASIPVLELTVYEGETVEEAALRMKKAEQAELEELFGKPTRSTDVQDF